MAQLVARFVRIEEVRSSNLLSSTISDVVELLTWVFWPAVTAKGSARRRVASSPSLMSMPVVKVWFARRFPWASVVV
jgi:hypothetical protein